MMMYQYLLLSVFCCLNLAVLGQVKEDEYTNFSLEELLDVEVTVASKTEETIADAPSSVTVFTRREMDHMGVTTLNELLQFVPGFQSARDVTHNTAWRIVARNIFSGPFNPRILILKDGVRLNVSHSGSSNRMARDLTLAGIKQVEIIRGSGSALYGSNAFLGVINLVTNRDETSVDLRAGELGGRYAALNLSQDISKFYFSLSASRYKDDGFLYEGLTERLPIGNNGPLYDFTRDPQDRFDAHFTLSGKKFDFTVSHQTRILKDFYLFVSLGNGINHLNMEHSFYSLKYKAMFAHINPMIRYLFSSCWISLK